MSLLLIGLALAAPGPPPIDDLHALLPTRTDTAVAVGAWAREDGWSVSPARAWLGGGERVALIAEATRAEPLAIEARGVDDDGAAGPWVPLEETWREDTTRVAAAELGGWWPAAQLRLADPGAVRRLGWEMIVPVEERADEPAVSEPVPPPLSSGLDALGVVTRGDWGASATTCTTTEDDWYRFAVHHTAGTQTYGGTVEGAVRALQAYSTGSGEYCDIPYQFLVGYDGSLYEGRPLTYLSGATYNNNPGNIAVCFLGCYSGSACGSLSNDDTDVMIVAARALVDVLAADHAISVSSDTLRGHRDWPDNSTNCPGDYVYARLDEVREPNAPYTATVVGWGFDGDDGTGLRIPQGSEVNVWIDARNDGSRDWTPGGTFLAPLPRDASAPYAGSGWPSATRAATPPATVGPGDTARFAFTLRGDALGAGAVSFALLQEGVTWFADAPYGGGPAEGAVTVSFEVVPPEQPDDAPDTDDGGGAGGEMAALPGEPFALAAGCGCAAAQPDPPFGAVGLIALTTLAAARRRRATSV
jgi:N-acetylmuramoyl-L-alanine amidase